jgi:hypothetical protein
MSGVARELLDAFDRLAADERAAVVAELLARYPVEAGPLPDAAFDELADELFRAYDAAEAADATPPR